MPNYSFVQKMNSEISVRHLEGLHGLNRHSLNKDFFLIEPQSIKALPVCFQDKARVISHKPCEDMCWGNSSRGFIFCQKKQNGLSRKILVLLQALMVLMMFYCLRHP